MSSTNNAIQATINAHGAKAVREVAFARIGGDKGAALARIGLQAKTIAEAVAIGDMAYAQMGAASQAIELAQATAALERFDVTTQPKPKSEWEWVVEDEDGEIIGVFASEDVARETAYQNPQSGNWDAVVYSRPVK